MVFVWVVLPHLQALCGLYLPGRLAIKSGSDLRKTILAALAAVFLMLWSAPAQWLVWHDAPSGAKRVTVETPLSAAHYLHEEYQKDRRLKRTVFTSETMGDYLLWDLRFDPPVHVTCYTHVHLLTPEHWRDCFVVKSGSHGWQEVLDRFGAQFVILEPTLHPRLTEQIRAAKERWQVVASEPVLIARRR